MKLRLFLMIFGDKRNAILHSHHHFPQPSHLYKYIFSCAEFGCWGCIIVPLRACPKFRQLLRCATCFTMRVIWQFINLWHLILRWYYHLEVGVVLLPDLFRAIYSCDGCTEREMVFRGNVEGMDREYTDYNYNISIYDNSLTIILPPDLRESSFTWFCLFHAICYAMDR